MKILSRLTGVVCLGPLVLPLLSGQVFGWTDSLCTGDALGQQKKPADKPPAADIKKFLPTLQPTDSDSWVRTRGRTA